MDLDKKNNYRIFLCGDVMIGRGIDQILHHPNDPQLYETDVVDAREYVQLAEAQNGKINYPVSSQYIWGDALEIWQKFKPDLKIINLETAITQSETHDKGKGIHYRLHPLNIDILTEAGINICTLANNHILDFGPEGLNETLTTLTDAHIQFAGAGENSSQAMRPAVFALGPKNRVLVFAIGSVTSGIPVGWQATSNTIGVDYLSDLNQKDLDGPKRNIKKYKKNGDLVILSIHWGSNWGHEISEQFQQFAHHLIDDAGVDVVFGHSSHHPRPIEIYHGKPILYGCGDFINDYEGISGYEDYRGDLSLMYFLDFDNTSLEFKMMRLVPLQIKHFSLESATGPDREWLLQNLNEYSAVFNMEFISQDDHFIARNKK